MGTVASKCCIECFKSQESQSYGREQELKAPLAKSSGVKAEPRQQTRQSTMPEELKPKVKDIQLEEKPLQRPADIKPQAKAFEEKKTEPVSLELDSKIAGPSFEVSYLNSVLDRAETEFISHINAPLQEEGSQEMVNKEGILVYAKEVPEGIMIKAQWTQPYNHQVFFDFLGNVNERLNWDKSLDSISIVNKYQPNLQITHARFKKVPMISPRDVLLVSKICKAVNGNLMINTSCDHPDCSPADNIVRATVKCSGYYVEQVSTNSFKVIYLSIVDFGGKVPKSILKSTSASHIPNFVKKVNSELAKLTSK